MLVVRQRKRGRLQVPQDPWSQVLRLQMANWENSGAQREEKRDVLGFRSIRLERIEGWLAGQTWPQRVPILFPTLPPSDLK